VVIVGLPGSGKTTVGRLVAERLRVSFVDLDAEIERRAGQTIAEIFTNGGELAFREREFRLTAELVARDNSVVAPGGGWMTNQEVVALLRPPGHIIHLHVAPATALSRMGEEVHTRPLLRHPDPLAALVRLNEERAPTYATADVVMDTETLSLQELVNQIATLAASWGVGVR
jgi:shikimate kinase